MSAKKRLRIRFHGRVQGVGFRYTAYHLAQSLGLTGRVQNEYDGTVLCEVQGAGVDIEMFLARLNNSLYIRSDDMDIKELELDEGERTFVIN